MTRHLARLCLVALVTSGLTACDEDMISLSEGDPSTLQVRAYVDADGNGTFQAGVDVPVAEATVTATSQSGEQLSATTGSDGLATFASVAPGSYQLSIQADVPGGAVLATASNPVVSVPFRPQELSAEFRYAFQPGSLSGRLFRDDNENGEFDAGEDTPASGVTVTLFRGTSTAGEPLAETTTDGEGVFRFEGLRPGEFTITVAAPPSVTLVGGAEQTVTVGADIAISFDLVFEGSFLISVAEARAAADGSPVTVEGTVTWAPDFDGRTAFIEDGTAGIVLFHSDGLGSLVAAGELAEGDVVRVTGEKGEFFSEVQVSGITSLEILESGSVPDPRLVTAAEINAGDFQAELVSNEGVVESVDVRSFGNQLVTLREPGGEVFTVWADSRTGVEEEAWTVGQTFGVTGVLGIDTREDLPFRMEVRSPGDLQAGGNIVSVAEARTRLGESVVVRGIVTWVSPDDRVIFFQDETGGMSTFDFDLPALARGDLVVLQGRVGAFRGEFQLSPVSDVQILGNVPVPSPMGITGAGLAAGEGQGELVVATGTVQSVETFSFDNHSVTLTDPAGTDFFLFVDSRTGIGSAFWTEGETVRVTGVVGNDDRNDPAARIEPRDPDDVVPASSGVFSIAEARAMLGETVTVEGVVTRQTPWQEEVYFFQDATGGISTFHGGAPDFSPGDRIQLNGEVDQFRGEIQFSPVNEVTVIGTTSAPDPLRVTADQINRGLFQGMLVALSGEVISVEVINQFGTQEVIVRDADGSDTRVLVDNRSGLSESDWTEGETVTVVGVLGFDERNDQAARLEVLLDTDVTFGS